MKRILTLAAIKAQNPSTFAASRRARLTAQDASPARRAVTFIEYILLAGIAVAVGGLILLGMKTFAPSVFNTLTSWLNNNAK